MARRRAGAGAGEDESGAVEPIADEEGADLDDALQSLLAKMEGVAIAAGRELTDASVRQMIRRQKTKAS